MRSPPQHLHIPYINRSSPSVAAQLSLSHRTSSSESSDGIRKRVCKACDRCRLKKSKCDGSNPCSRCKSDNAICVFGERKKSHDKVYPKGYVEMLEQQQSQLVSGLQEMYRRLRTADAWNGHTLQESNGNPLTHDILAALDLLEQKQDGSGMTESFEEDVQKIQSRLLAEGRGYAQRRGSVSSESENSNHGHGTTSNATPVLSRPGLFRDSFTLDSTASSPLVQSPVPHPLQHNMQPKIAPQSPPEQSHYNDPQLYAPEWAQALSDAAANQHVQSKLNYQQTTEEFDSMFVNNQLANGINYENIMTNVTSFPAATQYGNLQNVNDMSALDSMDVDFSKFVNPSVAMEVYI